MTFTIPEFWVGFALGALAALSVIMAWGFYLAEAKKRKEK